MSITGQRTKTVNLLLKDDAKKGYFVKGEMGDGPQDFYNVNGMLGAFRGVMNSTAMTANNGTIGSGETELDLRSAASAMP